MESMEYIEASEHPETRGFDLSAGNTWIYPENYPVRQYQYNIVKSALYHNTLVCLPTGKERYFLSETMHKSDIKVFLSSISWQVWERPSSPPL